LALGDHFFLAAPEEADSRSGPRQFAGNSRSCDFQLNSCALSVIIVIIDTIENMDS
jgi:hypothetical protein